MYLLGWYISEISSLIPHVPLLCFVVTISSASPFVQNGMLWGKGSFWESAWVLERTSSCSTLDTWSLMFTCVVDFGSAVDLGGWHVQECLGPWFQAALEDFGMILNDGVLSGNSGPAHALFCLDMCYFYSFVYWFLLRIQLSNSKYYWGKKGLLWVGHPFNLWPLGKNWTRTLVWCWWDHFCSFNP